MLSGRRKNIVQSPALQGFVFAIIWLLVTNITIYFIYVRSVKAIKEEIREGLLRNVSVAATTIDGDKHRLFTAETSPNDPVYLAFIGRMEEIRKASKDVRYLYTNIAQNGKIYFVANGSPQNDNDNDGQPDTAPQLMDPYPDAGSALKEALKTQSPKVDREPYTDVWGTFYSLMHLSRIPRAMWFARSVWILSSQRRSNALNQLDRCAACGFHFRHPCHLFGVAVWFFRSRNILRPLVARSRTLMQFRTKKQRAGCYCNSIRGSSGIVDVPQEAKDQHATALLRYAAARKGMYSNHAENFDPLEIIRSCLTDVVS